MQPIPLIGTLLGAQNTANGIMLPEFYNQLGAMHGTIMITVASADAFAAWLSSRR